MLYVILYVMLYANALFRFVRSQFDYLYLVVSLFVFKFVCTEVALIFSAFFLFRYRVLMEFSYMSWPGYSWACVITIVNSLVCIFPTVMYQFQLLSTLGGREQDNMFLPAFLPVPRSFMESNKQFLYLYFISNKLKLLLPSYVHLR